MGEVPTPYVRGRPRLTRAFLALQYPNYRLWFGGQLVSLIGTWMQITAQSFLVFQMTNSPVYLGYVGFAAGIPPLIFMLYGGVVADRVTRRRLLMVTQGTMMILAFVLAGLTFSSLVQPWHIILLAFGLGMANAFDVPARQAFVLEMVDRRSLTNAIALNSTMFTLATVIGPAVGGATYAAFGPGWCFSINGLSFIAVIVALGAMKLAPLPPRRRTASALEELREGLHFALSHRLIRTIVGVTTVTSLFTLAFVTLLPAWAVDVLGGDSNTYGLLQASRGFGALLGATTIAYTGAFGARGKLLTTATLAFPALVLLFAFVQSLPLSLLVLVGVGWAYLTLFNMANTLVQSLVPDGLRGRVMSVYTLTFFGFMPIGALLAGGLAQAFNEPITVMIGAGVGLAFGLVVLLGVPQLMAVE